jgi:hypothetical protein
MLTKTSIFIVLIGVASLTGTDQVEQLPWGTTVEGCRLGASTDKEQYDFGQPINLHLVLQNKDRDRLKLSEGSDFGFTIEIISPNQQTAHLTLWGEGTLNGNAMEARRRLITLAHGDTTTASIMLNRAYDMTLDGKYTISAHRIIPSNLDADAWVDVSSNKVIVEIRTQKSN